ncbi:MAG: hypothetical protein M1834_003104 [Cirrosporium novae-zelandiae]|nr:MAG: hypothetical protein M1834_003104 [Cirrosporium novae-zelandiae]
MSWKRTDALMKTIKHYSDFPATGVSLRQMVQFGEKPSSGIFSGNEALTRDKADWPLVGTLFRASQFLSEELPIRLAHRVQELCHLPDGLGEMPSIERVRDWYAASFEDITSLPRPTLSSEVRQRLLKAPKKNGHSRAISQTTPNPSIEPGQYRSTPEFGPSSENGNGNNHTRTYAARRYYVAADDGMEWPPELAEYNRRFAKCLNTVKRRHDAVVTTVAQGIIEWKRRRQRMQIDSHIQSFLDRFYMSRIGIRMLIGQHVALTDQNTQNHPDYVGIICTKTNVRELAEEAIDNARYVCEDHYGLFEAPKVQLVCNPDINFMYVPGHLSHMLFETLKNSLRAVVETHGHSKKPFPVTKVIVAEGKEDITIKISDEGGGIPRSAIPLVWTYMYTTVEATPNLEPDFDKSDFKAPMAGFGYGLPISRLYARYFGGDLKLITVLRPRKGTPQAQPSSAGVQGQQHQHGGVTMLHHPHSQLLSNSEREQQEQQKQQQKGYWGGREVSERKQVGDAASRLQSQLHEREHWKRLDG